MHRSGDEHFYRQNACSHGPEASVPGIVVATAEKSLCKNHEPFACWEKEILDVEMSNVQVYWVRNRVCKFWRFLFSFSVRGRRQGCWAKYRNFAKMENATLSPKYQEEKLNSDKPNKIHKNMY